MYLSPSFCTEGDIPRNISFTEAKNTFFEETSLFIASELFEISKCRHSDGSGSSVAVSVNVARTYVVCLCCKIYGLWVIPFLQNRGDIQGVTGGMDKTSGECSLC